MLKKIDLSGVWDFHLDVEKQGATLPYDDTINLPGTTAYYKKGKKNLNREIGFLTEEYKFEGYAWFSRIIDICEEDCGKNYFLYLERTRVTTLWINGKEVGTQDTLSAPHVYDVTEYLTGGQHVITICVDNTSYKTRGGHLTSQDTQTNWNGITGRIELQVFNKAYISSVKVYTNISDKSVNLKANVIGAEKGEILVSAESFNGSVNHKVEEKSFDFEKDEVSITYMLGKEALLWSEFEPNLYKIHLNLVVNGILVDTYEVTVGLRDFTANGDKFEINGKKTFLRGKHDGLIFPLTGFAPTTVEEWIEVLEISKSYGMNHYRFHTCCPPEAAFTAADIVGIYMEPELPFWGTMTDENDENHNKVEQEYLINEGFLMLEHFGNHPSFVMMSLGNELWGSKERLNEILGRYKESDTRHLYTQGCNNYQFTPVVLENDDFFCGVRFAKERLIRGSYGMCDAPLGHVQVGNPSTMKDYDENICPKFVEGLDEDKSKSDDTIEIQFGTVAKKVKATEYDDKMIPTVPVISHEIGQYATFPNFNEIEKYTGALKARNFEVFRERLEEKGIGDLAEKYFNCSGKLAVECYKEELEAAFRSKKLAGFQLLDLQDFSGQGTALVGVLDAFMESKGTVTPEEWRSFCSDAVLMAKFEKYNYLAEESFNAEIELCYYRNLPLNNINLLWSLKDTNTVCETGKIETICTGENNYIQIGHINITMPNVEAMKKLTLTLSIEGTDIEKEYNLWAYPKGVTVDRSKVNIFNELSEAAMSLLEKGKNILLLPNLDNLKNTIDGFYCTDFWCYPMFRTISESMNKEVAVGTMGLLIDNNHPVLNDFVSEEYSTYQWWNIVTNSKSIILDGTKKELRPIVQTIDNFERNHKMGFLFECNVLNGKVMVCSCDFDKIIDKPEGKQLLFSIINYIDSQEFNPKCSLEVSGFTQLFN